MPCSVVRTAVLFEYQCCYRYAAVLFFLPMLSHMLTGSRVMPLAQDEGGMLLPFSSRNLKITKAGLRCAALRAVCLV